MESSIKIIDIIQSKKQSAEGAAEKQDNTKLLDVEPIEIESIDQQTVDEDVAKEIEVNFSSVEPIELFSITDTYGRLSDSVEYVEKLLGVSVVPLEMCCISPEVVELKRHKIYEFEGHRLAMSSKIREDVVEKYKDKIYKTLSMGTVYEEVLNTKVTYNGEDYDSLALSEAEWTYVLSLYRLYKSRLYVTSSGKMTMEIQAERR